jgi:branched-chain amino acid transport system permease protein
MTAVVEGRYVTDARHARRGRVTTAVSLLVVAVLVAMPPMLSEGSVRYAITMLIAALYAMGFNVLWSQARLLSFGSAAPFGIGAFCVVHAMQYLENASFSVPTPLVPLIGMLGGLVMGLLIGYFATVRTGTYFSMITLAMTQLLAVLARRWDSVFGGETGLSSMRMPWAGIAFGTFHQVYYVVLFWSLLGIAALWYLGRTPLGSISFALGNNERRLEFLGFNIRVLKLQIVTVSSAVAGLAGGLLAFTTENASYQLFSGYTSADPIIQSFFGGVGTFLGPALGAVALSFFGQILSDATRIWLLYQGVLFILVITLLPIGVGGAIAALCSGRAPWSRISIWILIALAGILLCTVGTALIGELSYRFFLPGRTKDATLILLGGWSVPITSIAVWAVGLFTGIGGLALIRRSQRRIRESWTGGRR